MEQMDLTNKEELLQYLKQHGLWAKKGLGQNFLVDKNALGKIVETADLSKDNLVVEVGPGVGTLTEELVNHAGDVVAVEKDDKLVRLLAEMTKSKYQITNKIPIDKILKNGNLDFDLTLEIRALELVHKLRIINADILKLNLNEIIGNKPYKVVANIPYYITSKILELFLSADHKPETIVLLVQKEVAERICAKEGSMSVLSVSVQLFGKPEIAGIVPASSFFPSPKVDSAILKIVVSNQLSVVSKEQEREFFRCVHIGFASRRKTLVNNLSAGYRIDKATCSDIIKSVGLSENVRAQELSISDWQKLCKMLDANCSSHI